jgi:DNA-binding MurR/RpiR family transcriptional regulator
MSLLGGDMKMTIKTIKNYVSEAALTKTEKKIADFILNQPNKACFLTSTDIAREAKVSYTSVIRFSRALGFNGFTMFQKFLREEQAREIPSLSASLTVPTERLTKSAASLSNIDLFENHKNNVFNNINSIALQNKKGEFEEASELLLNAERKFVIGTRSRAGMAEFLALILNQLVDNVFINTSQAMTPFDFIASCNPKDILIIISFPRYSNLDITTAKMAFDSKSKIILITDNATSPIAKYANVVLLVNIDSNTYFTSYTSVQFLCELLCAHISAKIGTDNKKKLAKINKYLNEQGLY